MIKLIIFSKKDIFFQYSISQVTIFDNDPQIRIMRSTIEIGYGLAGGRLRCRNFEDIELTIGIEAEMSDGCGQISEPIDEDDILVFRRFPALGLVDVFSSEDCITRFENPE